ncbi:NADH dehydrogenase [ubiquinone] 1 beta subcomplex subunit 5, mitochondrial-like [Watersipora subatra]|uniref:NADH dehydrogenase [ubiquinone] 1 beta subcomplex subunit 5, mitochondrial-like n=1 Tax=Watersipora subatra TaxID=2589382 RepID=UPI00355AE810
MASPVWRSFCSQLIKTSRFRELKCSKSLIAGSVANGCKTEISRGMASGPRKIVITPTKFQWFRFKNDLHFYLMLTGLPLGAWIFYANFIQGEAELAEIPEGYEPKHWEYYKHPIRRWFARYIYEDPVKLYEMEAAEAVLEFEEARCRARRKLVKDMIHSYDDYRAYYFVPAVDPRFTESVREGEKQRVHLESGTR